jgi:hypothetical protein
MSGSLPSIITGATAKIRLNGKTLAFCQDFTCSIQVLTKVPKVLGKYEGDSVEPLGYSVSGSFTIIRYAKGIRKLNGPGGSPIGLAENDAGNGVGNWGGQWGGSVSDHLSRYGIGNDGRANEALDPSKFGGGTTFDIQIYQKVQRDTSRSTSHTAEGNLLRKVTDIGTGDNFLDEGPKSETINYLGILNIKKARITQADFSLNKRSAAVERFTFVALYVDGDGFVANSSAT